MLDYFIRIRRWTEASGSLERVNKKESSRPINPDCSYPSFYIVKSIFLQ
jgi:hypothetical protein